MDKLSGQMISGVNKESMDVSVIMPALNAQNTIERSLASVRDQDYDQKKIEILVVDGGSTDNTIEIAGKYNAGIIPNPGVQPECGKYEGIKAAKGRYLMFLDADEVLGRPDSISKRINILETHPYDLLIFGGYQKPDGFSFINDYINIFSEPFSNFIYGVPTDCRYFLDGLNKKFELVKQNSLFSVFSYKNRQPPLFDMCAGNIIDRKKYLDLINEFSLADIPKIFYRMTEEDTRFAVLKNDFITHYSSDTLNRFLKKIRWRILSNLFFKDKTGAGFSNRQEFSSNKHKKYLFIPYAFSVILPFAESVIKALKYKNAALLIHTPLTIYTASLILYYSARLMIKRPPQLTRYG